MMMWQRFCNAQAGITDRTMASRLGQMGRKLGQWIPPALVGLMGRPAAVFFHGVENAITDPLVRINHHEAPVFEAVARTLKTHFDVLPLSELDDALAEPKRHRRTLFLMSDDGYANTLTTAAPILENLGLPWTLFVSSRHVDTGERNPIFLARLFFHHAPPGDYPIVHLPLQRLGAPEGREGLAQAGVAALKSLDMARAEEAVAAMVQVLADAGLADLIDRYPSERFLTWSEVRDLKARGVEIGAHADWHWPMNAAQTQTQLTEQARRPRARIEAEVGPCRSFAYPFGNTADVCQTAWRAVRDAGYDCAFTTVSATLDASDNRFLLPRYEIGPAQTRVASLVRLLAAGNPRLARWQTELAA